MRIPYSSKLWWLPIAFAILVFNCSKAENKKTAADASSPAGPASAKSLVDFYSGMGLVLKDSVSGDLNKDSLPDLILLFNSKAAPPGADLDTVEPRPLVILSGAGNGLFKRELVNWHVALCRTCGAALSDPYLRVVIKNGFFSVEQTSSDAMTYWKRTTTFKYSDSLKSWMLHKDDMTSSNVYSDPIENKKSVKFRETRARKDFGSIALDSFNIYDMDDHYASITASDIFPVSFGPGSSYQPWNRTKGGVWNILDFCTDRINNGYLFFAKSSGDASESASESDLGITYSTVMNRSGNDTCKGFAFRHIPSIKPGKTTKGVYDSLLNAFHAAKDTVGFGFEPLPADSTKSRLVFKRGGKSQAAAGEFYSSEFPGVAYCGDLNNDGFLDFIFDFTSGTETYQLFLSQKDSQGGVAMVGSGGLTFTE
jgi:hypothetical protein